jgi:hypothetical protein
MTIQQPPAIDPDNVPEILCEGMFNVFVDSKLATLTFTHRRPDAAAMMGNSIMDMRSVVRARIVMTLDNLKALRDTLDRVVQMPDQPAPAAGGFSKH